MNDGPNLLDYLVPGYATLSLFKWLSHQLGCHEAALRLIVSLLVAYPLCIVYNLAFTKKSLQVKHLYLFLSGFSIGFFNYGFNIFHTFATILVVYSTLNVFGGKRTSVAAIFIFCMSYLLWGYYHTQTDEYAFEWTIPQCVLTLRLIAFTFDFYDGQRLLSLQKKDDTSQETAEKIVNNPEALLKPPSLLHVLSHCYFPGSFLVGPQVGFHRYLNFIAETDNHLPTCMTIGLKRLVLGLIYLAVFQIGSLYWPLKYLLFLDFQQSSFIVRFTTVMITMKIQLCKYVSIWLLSEGCCVMSGLTYDKEKKQPVESCSNIDPWEFEFTPTFGGIIRSFNISTNAFASKYIFKRLKFAGSKTISHFCTLFFLALWHGWKSGYYVTFLMEFLIMKMEWEVTTLVMRTRKANPSLDRFLSAFYIRWLSYVILRVYTMYMFSYCLVSFTLLSYHRWYPVLSQLYFCGHIVYGSWIFVSWFL